MTPEILAYLRNEPSDYTPTKLASGLDVFPGASFDNAIYALFAHTKSDSQITLECASGTLRSNDRYGTGGQFGIWTLLAAPSRAVIHLVCYVLFWRTPLKIGQGIIARVSIFMARLMPWGARPHESLKHKSMSVRSYLLTPHYGAQAEIKKAARSTPLGKNYRSPITPRSPGPNTPIVADAHAGYRGDVFVLGTHIDLLEGA